MSHDVANEQPASGTLIGVPDTASSASPVWYNVLWTKDKLVEVLRETCPANLVGGPCKYPNCRFRYHVCRDFDQGSKCTHQNRTHEKHGVLVVHIATT